MEEIKTNFNRKRLLITLTLVLLTAGAVGGGVYYVLDSNFKKERTDNEKALSELQDEVKKLKTEDKTTNTAVAKDETADWKTYTNEAWGISFKYPSKYNLKPSGSFQVGSFGAGRLESELQDPSLQILFNPDGLGGCMFDLDDIYYDARIQGNKLVINDRQTQTTNSCNEGKGDGIVRVKFSVVGGSVSEGKNSLFFNYSFKKGENYEAELRKILDTVNISKPNLYL
jgi:hypothetical protein